MMEVHPRKRSPALSILLPVILCSLLFAAAWTTYRGPPYLTSSQITSDQLKRVWFRLASQGEDTATDGSISFPLSPPLAPPPPPPPSTPPCAGCVVSNATIMATLTSSGMYLYKRYIYQNVWLKNNETLVVYLHPSSPLPEPLVVDGVHINASTRGLPTAVWYKGSADLKGLLKIEYYHANSSENQPQCENWVDRPVYMMTTPHHRNVWHMFNDALMAAFQTLREERLLPLAEIDEEGNMSEYINDLEEKCPRKYDINGIPRYSTYRPEVCRARTGYITQTQCDRTNQKWCQPGLVAVNRTQGPILMLTMRHAFPLIRWRHLFKAVSGDIRTWDEMVGSCFRTLYMGSSNTLNMYLAGVNVTTAKFGTKFTLKLRKDALHAFRRVIRTAEVAKRTNDDGEMEVWDGYPNPWFEKLRQGFGPENIKMIKILRRQRHKGIDEDEEYSQEHKDEIKQMIYVEGNTSRTYLDKALQEEDSLRAEGRATAAEELNYFEAGAPGGAIAQEESQEKYLTRPVVTFMWRRDVRRCILNEGDILEYLLTRYNVTVRVTTFEEPFLEMVDLMNSTDVLLGMHGAGWTNALFLKQGAAALQLYPYGWSAVRFGREITIRGGNYKNIVKFIGGVYAQWMNPYVERAVARPRDFNSSYPEGTDPLPKFTLQPQPDWPPASYGVTPPVWIYQNTLVHMESFAPVLDGLLAQAGIFPKDMPTPLPLLTT